MEGRARGFATHRLAIANRALPSTIPKKNNDCLQSIYVTSHAKAFLTASHFETDSRSDAVHTDWDAVCTAQATHSKKIASCSHSLGYPFKKNCQPFTQLELSVQKKLSAVRGL